MLITVSICVPSRTHSYAQMDPYGAPKDSAQWDSIPSLSAWEAALTGNPGSQRLLGESTFLCYDGKNCLAGINYRMPILAMLCEHFSHVFARIGRGHQAGYCTRIWSKIMKSIGVLCAPGVGVRSARPPCTLR